MSLRADLLAKHNGDEGLAAADLADGLTRGDPGRFQVGYSIPNAILAAREMFPAVDEATIRFINLWDEEPWSIEEEID